jgi:hypothetical protein
MNLDHHIGRSHLVDSLNGFYEGKLSTQDNKKKGLGDKYFLKKKMY